MEVEAGWKVCRKVSVGGWVGLGWVGEEER